jgi:hypothetical protein
MCTFLCIIIIILLLINYSYTVSPRRKWKRKKLTVLFNGQITKGEHMNLSVDKVIQITIAEADQFGNAEQGVSPDAPGLAFTVNDPTLGVLTPGADGLSASFQPSGKIGALVVSVSGSFGGQPLNGSGSGTLVAGAITQLTLNLVQ